MADRTQTPAAPLRQNGSEPPPTQPRSGADLYLLPWAGRPQPSKEGASQPAEPLPPYITSQGRDLRVDLLRGYFVLAMIVDHVRGASPLYLLTGGNRFFASAAEGFILTSGLMAGLIYRRIVARDGIVMAARKAWARAFSLYLLTVGMTLVLLPLSELLGLPWAQGVDLTHSLELVVSVLTLHRTYYLVDVLLLYTLLFALMPLALLLMADGKTKVLLGVSWALWGVHQFLPDAVTVTWPIAGNYLFTFAAWQLLFVNGLVLGFQRDRIRSLTAQGARRLQGATGIASLGLIALYALTQVSAGALPAQLSSWAPRWEQAQLWLQQYVFGKADLRPGRLVADVIVFTFMFLTLTRQWRIVHRPMEWLLVPLGQNSLNAFTAHVAVTAVVAAILLPFGLAQGSPWWLNALIQVASVLFIWLLVQRHVLEPTPKVQPVWKASPVAVALLAVIILPWLPTNPSLASAAVANVTPGATIAVSDAVLARARAFGTPVASLSQVKTPQGIVNFSTAVPSEQPATAALAPIGDATEAIPPSSPSALLVVTGTPVPPSSEEKTARPTPAAAPRPVATSSAPALATPVAATVAARSVAAQEVSKQAVAQPASRSSAGASASVGSQFVVNWTSSEPVPALPPDSARLVNPYVGQLAGRAYALSFHSDLLNRDMPYWVYLPPDYGKTNRRYPVLYMLHGGGGSLEEWAAYGLFDMADLAMRLGTVSPMIIVLPQGDVSYWANWVNNSQRWGDYLAYEVVWQIDSAFATVRSPSARAIGGLSMGAWGALHQAFTHPDIFGVVGAHSPSFYPDHNNLQFLGTDAEFASKDPLSLARWIPAVHSLRIWIDVGQADPWVQEATTLHAILQARGVAHSWHLNPGGHSGDYWAGHVPDYLEFYSRALTGA